MKLFVTLMAVTFMTNAPIDEPKAGLAIPIGGGALAADGKVIFAPAKTGGIEALELATGKVLWTNTDARRLAGASSRLVIGWTGNDKKPNSFRLTAIDAATGRTVRQSDAIEMPEWATTTRIWGRTFRVAAEAGEKPVLVWQANAHYAGGARPTPEIEEAARKQASGVVEFDLKTGKLSILRRDPKEAEWKVGPEGGVVGKLGEHELHAIEMTPGFKPGAPMTTTVTLTVSRGNKELWKRELAGNPWSPPPP